MDKYIDFTINTPDNEFYSGKIQRLNTEGSEGRFAILPNHVSMISALIPTVTSFIDLNGNKVKVFTSTGVLRMYHSKLEIICNVCEWPENIDIARAEQAKERAEERLRHKDTVDVKRAENALLRSLMRIRAVE